MILYHSFRSALNSFAEKRLVFHGEEKPSPAPTPKKDAATPMSLEEQWAKIHREGEAELDAYIAKAKAAETAKKAPKVATRKTVAAEARQEITAGRAPDIAGPYVANFAGDVSFAAQDIIKRKLDVRRADNEFPMKIDIGGVIYVATRTKSSAGTYLYDIKKA